MTLPHKWSKAIRNERVPYGKRTDGYIGPVRLLKLSKRKKADLAKLPTKLAFKENGSLQRVFDIQDIPA